MAERRDAIAAAVVRVGTGVIIARLWIRAALKTRQARRFIPEAAITRAIASVARTQIRA